MTDKIIALVDGSIYSESVCDHAAWISTRTGAPVELVHVLGRREAPESTDLSGSIRLGARSKLLEDLAALDAERAKLVSQRGRAILEDARAILDAKGVTEITTRLRRGDVVETISEIEADADLIVVGKRGEAADFARGHLGSNLERIVRSARRPVLVAARAFAPIGRVLVAHDGNRLALKAVEEIATSGVFSGLSVTVVRAGSPSVAAEESLEAARARLDAAGLTAAARLVEGRPEEVLGRLVEEEGFDLLVMGAYGHSRIRSFVIGSTTTEMVRSCKVPVLLVH